MDFTYWNKLREPEKFLENDWDNPARAWAGRKVAEAVRTGARSMVEIGPGNGVDYDRHFRQLVHAGEVSYEGYEGSRTLRDSLATRYPEALWENRQILDLQPGSFDIVYEKAVLEHQPDLEPSLSCILSAARKFVILIWYRPPGDLAAHEVGAAGEHYHTFRRIEVLDVIGRAGWQIQEETLLPGEGNVGWVLTRIVDATP